MDLPSIAAVHDIYGSSLTVVYFDAHADLNSHQTSPSGRAHGMPVRALLGEGPAVLMQHVKQPLSPSQVCFIYCKEDLQLT